MQNLSADALAAFDVLDREPVVSHWSAAQLWGMPTFRPPDELLHLTRPRVSKGTERTYQGLVIHHAGIPPEHRTVEGGLRVTTPARTVVDVARGSRSVRGGVVIADSALRLELCDREEMLAVWQACRRWPGAGRARTAAMFADPGGASPLESVSRWEMACGGIPTPLLQQWITADICVDFLWPGHRVVGEADGRLKYTSRDDLYREKRRQERLEELGYRVVRWGWDDAVTHPASMLARLRRRLTSSRS
jgi:very-short-patch-repair endonuclease